MSYKITIAGCQQVAHTSSVSTASGAVINAKSIVVYSTADCFINIGAAAAATGAGSVFVPASTFLELNTIGLEQSTIQARSVSTSGTLYVNPIGA